MVSTSFGSTAYNLSFNGSIVHHSLHTLQITSIAPLNSKVYSSLRNSIVIPQEKQIIIKPSNMKKSFIITIDGENKLYNDITSIKIVVRKKRIQCFRNADYHFINKVHEKFLKS